MRTETAFILNQATSDMYDELGVDEYEFLGTLDSKTCENCGGLDGKHYISDEKKIGINYPPMHPWCRCTTIPYFPEDEDEDTGQRIARGADGKNYYVPADMTYKEWRERQSLLKKPSILSDNKYKLLPNDIMKDVRKAEQSISEDSIENLLIYDRKGNLLISEAGISSKVEVPKSSKKNIKGCIMTHNHPSGKTFSVEDVQTLFFSGVAELRATTKDGTFILRQPKTWHKGLSRPYKIRKEYEDILYSLQDKYIDIYNRDGLLLNQVEAMWTDETLKIFTKKFGLEYKFERW